MQGLLATELVEDKIKKITLSVFLGQEKSGAIHNAQALTQPISLSPTTDESGAPLQCDTCRTTVKSASMLGRMVHILFSLHIFYDT